MRRRRPRSAACSPVTAPRPGAPGPWPTSRAGRRRPRRPGPSSNATTTGSWSSTESVDARRELQAVAARSSSAGVTLGSPPGAAERSTALAIVLAAFGLGALLLAAGLAGFSKSTSEALSRVWVPLAVTLVCWTAAGALATRATLPRACAGAAVGIAAPVVSLAIVGLLGLPSGLEPVAAVAVWLVVCGLPLHRLLRR